MRRRFAIWFVIASSTFEVRWLGGRRVFMWPRLAMEGWYSP